MFAKRRRRARRLFLAMLWLSSSYLAGGVTGWSQAMATDATAATLTPGQIDQQWIVATARFAHHRGEVLRDVDRTTERGPFRAEWSGLSKQQVPQWFRDAKFGIFIHWGVLSVPAFGSECYSRNISQQGDPDFTHHVASYGVQTQVGYKDFIPRFPMRHFDPAAWATLFENASARDVGPVAEDHDGFALYGSTLTEWNVGPMGPHAEARFRSEDFRFTTNKGFLYAIELGWPKGGEAIVHSLGTRKISCDEVTLVGSKDPLRWRQQADGLHISLPVRPIGKYAYTFRIKAIGH